MTESKKPNITIEEVEALEIALKKLNYLTTEYIDWDTARDELLRQD